MEKTVENVKEILKKYPETRSSDFLLIIYYIRHYCPDLSRYIGFIPSDIIQKYEGIFEKIRRTRQKIQEQGFYLPDPSVIERRKKLSKKYRKMMPKIEI